MKLSNLYFIIPSIAIVLLNLFWGSAISWMLSISIVACLLYYLGQINVEQIVYRKTNAQQPSEALMAQVGSVIKKYKTLLSFSLLTIVFIASVVCIYFITNPPGKQPWFFNNEYHGLNQTAIAFQQTLVFDKGNIEGKEATVSMQPKSNGVQLQFSNFFEPVMAQLEDGAPYTPINNIFPTPFQQSFTLSNGLSTINVQIAPDDKTSILDFIRPNRRKDVVYTIQLHSKDPVLSELENVAIPYTDNITLNASSIKEGQLLYTLLLNSRNFKATKNESYAVLDYILREMGNTYILANYSKGEKKYTLFPAAALLQKGYQMKADGANVTAQLQPKYVIAKEQKFYIGFHNVREKLFFNDVALQDYGYTKAAQSVALYFDYPPTYLLKSPSTLQHAGDKNIRFVTNDKNQLLATDLKEGFLFNNYGMQARAAISATIDYTTQAPNVPLDVNVADNNRNSLYHKVKGKQFYLQSQQAGIQYLFNVRDFSDNGFRYSKLMFLAGVLYLSMLAVLVFFPGRQLVRIEPILFSVIYVLVMLRFILFWRLATFPPLENISKYELENTLINFDYRWGNIPLPIPLTLIWVMLFLLALVSYRIYIAKGKSFVWNPESRWSLNTTKRITKAFVIYMACCHALFYINAWVLHTEILTRITSILFPLLGYCYFATLANKYYVFDNDWVLPQQSKLYVKAKAYIHYLVYNPAFILTLLTIAFFLITDRGFAILFTLFVLLKNIFLNFLKKPFDSSKTTLGRMLLQPNHYWVYGILALIVYLTILSFKSLFYYLITYKLIVLGLGLLLPTLVLLLFYKQYKRVTKVMVGISAIYLILLAMPFSRNILEDKATAAIKHVQFRASIIHQPISDMLEQNPYSSFQTRKIIETAENQWFINAYTAKPYDNSSVINLRPYSRVGVDYNTQTRDVVVARFIIAELGVFSMYLILVLLLLPLIIYLISYRLTDDGYRKLNFKSYAGLLPLLLLFTISLFVWLTSTNRFVFFGQDFPFLSLTSKLSVVLPLLLYGYTLVQQPETYRSYQLNLKTNFARYAFFTVLVAAFALTTVRKNTLSTDNFSVVVEKTKSRINKDFNGILLEVQDSLDAKGVKYAYATLIKAVAEDSRFKALVQDSVIDKYTKSIFQQLIEKPSSAFRVDNPLYIQYDNYQYTAVYNDHLYLQLPPLENRKVWNGSITEDLNLVAPLANITYNNNNILTALPYFKEDKQANIQFAVMPAQWMVNAKNNIGLLNVKNGVKDKATLFIYKNADNNMIQSAVDYVSTCDNEDLVSVSKSGQQFLIAFNNAGNYFAVNKWINGNYKILYPLKDRFFWMYNFANAVRSGYTDDSLLHDNVPISLDFKLVSSVQQAIDQTYSNMSNVNNKFKFTVIAADGDGNIRLMGDKVINKTALDPNDNAGIQYIQQKHFFFSNIRNERDQWGNPNLLAMHLGPGSSVKPLIAATVASQVNAGWQNLNLAAPVQAEYNNYGGFKLLKPWKNDDHYRAGYLTMDRYIEVSSNFYHSTIMFLGSYPKSAFVKDGKASIANVLQTQAGANNTYPNFNFNGNNYFLPNYNNRKGNWPSTDPAQEKGRTFFGDENAILANGLEINAGLRTKDKDKQGNTPESKINILDSARYSLLSANRGSALLWSMPEQSSLYQSLRSFKDPHQNFNIGLKTATLGGYPYQVSPFKMLEMYLSLFTQNRNFSLHIMPQNRAPMPWQVDDTWTGQQQYNQFLAQYIFKGMNDVIYGGWGTAKALSGLKSAYPQYYFYAKTGTINEQGSGSKNSRRLIVTIANKNLQEANNIGQKDTKLFSFYFVIDNNKDFDWSLLHYIIKEAMATTSVQQYFKS
jgi:hypothetical protein